MARFKFNRGFSDQLQKTPDVRQALMGAARAAARAASDDIRVISKGHAGWMPRRGHPPVIIEDDGERVLVVNTDYAGVIQEYGSINNPPHAPLRRGARAAGARFKEL